MTNTTWTEDELERLYALKAQGESPSRIARLMKKPINAVRHRLRYDFMSADEKKKRARDASKRRGNARSKSVAATFRVLPETPLQRPTPEMLRDRDIRAVLPHRDLTGAFFGDPPIGLSALEGRR